MSDPLGTPETGTGVKVVRFPADRCLGQLVVKRKGVASEPLAAQGEVEVPANAGLMLLLDDEGCADPEPLRDLGADDVHALVASGDFGDRGLAAVAGLTSLSMIQVEGEVTDAGLASLAGLTKLAVLSIQVGDVTEAGIAHVAALPILMQLTLKGAVPASALGPLAGARQLAGLNLSNADAATVDVAREVLPEIPINGTWLSAKARQKLAAATSGDVA